MGMPPYVGLATLPQDCIAYASPQDVGRQSFADSGT